MSESRVETDSHMASPVVTVAIPSLNQARYLETAISSLLRQDIPLEIFVIDGGSSDDSVEILERWSEHLAGWRSYKDDGQAAAINEGIAMGTAPYVYWLNSDDYVYPNGLRALLEALDVSKAPAAYGRCWNVSELGRKCIPYFSLGFSRWLLANYCFIPQPSTIIRRNIWESVGGLDESLDLAMDYDLWWRIFTQFGEFKYVKSFVSANRMHAGTKTHNSTGQHYAESIAVVRKHYGRVPLKWRVAKPIVSFARSLTAGFRLLRGNSTITRLLDK